MTPPMHNELHN